jgi:cyclophilin family peptidyl-prolyl cis-trans isomerase
MRLPKMLRRLRAAAATVDVLENRCLLSATAVAPIPAETIVTNSSPAPISLGNYFDDPTIIPGDTLVDIQTNLPAPNTNIPILLTNAATPITVANFLHYISSGEYANTIIHRSIPGFIIQGGGDTTTGSQIPSFGAIPGESSTATLKNTTGTIAMALSTGPNSAAREWFFNLADNPFLDDTSDGGPFTAFGSVIYNGMNTLDAIAALPTVDGSSFSPEWANLPLQNFPGASGSILTQLPATNQFVVIQPAVDPLRGLTYSAVSTNPTLISATVSGGSLNLDPLGGTGSANIMVTATDLGGGTVTSSFSVNVTNPPLSSATVGTGAAKSITYTDGNGTTGIITWSGPGAATVNFSGTSLGETTTKNGTVITGTNVAIAGIATTGSTTSSILTVSTKVGAKPLTVGGLITTSLKSFTAPDVILTGNVNASGSIASLNIAGANGGAIIASSLGAVTDTGDFSDNLTLSAKGVSLGQFTAASVSSGTWALAGSVSSVVVTKQNLDATIAAGSISNLFVRGSLSAATLNLQATGNDISTLAVGGAITGSLVNAAGNIGNVFAASLLDSEIYAGVAALPPGTLLPNLRSGFVRNASIGSVELQTTRGSYSFSNSAIAAAHIGILSLGTVQTQNITIPNGVAAESIGILIADTNKPFLLFDLTASTNLALILNRDGVTLGTDFLIELL